MDWLNFGEGAAAGGTIELVAAVGIFLATRYVTPVSPRTLTTRRGQHRAFIDRATNHRERWLWRVVEVPFNKLIASGEQESELLAVNAALGLIKELGSSREAAADQGRAADQPSGNPPRRE